MNIGPQAQRMTPAGQAWAKRAPIVKGISQIAIFQDAPPDAWRIFRWRFTNQDVKDAGGAFRQIMAILGSYRHPKLLVEVYNELPKESTEAQIAFYKLIVPLFAAEGIKVIGPCWGTGDYDLEQWALFRAADWCGFFAIALHAYWANATPQFTKWNALRWRDLYDPVLDKHRLVFITECGRDKVQDGPNGTMLGAGGYIADKVSVPAFADEVNRFAAQLLPHEFCTPFVCGPERDQVNYDMDPVAPLIDIKETPMPTPKPPAFDVGPGLKKSEKYIGPFVEGQTYDAPGTDREVGKIATPKGYACWSKATNETIVYVNDGTILVDDGNHAIGLLRQIRGPFPKAP